MKRSENEAVRRPDTRDDATPWKLYNRLIEGIPEDIAVRDYCLERTGPTSRPIAAWA